jgi:ABC-type lipoprotein release transport system permease subunit
MFIMLASIIAGVLSSILPITKICKEKPVDLIRKP